ncbi:hypothetical protein GCM10027447_10610 [Glycomyces halotolerans]
MTSQRGGAPPDRATAGQDLARLGERFTALFIDWVACLVFTYLLEALGLLQLDFNGVNLTTPILFIVYYTSCFTVGTQSLGMAVMKIACVSATTGDRLGLGRALVRAVLLSLVLPALTALADPYHRGLHDRAAGSVMLKTRAAQRR